MSGSRALFEQARAGGMTWVNSLIGVQEENEVVDFKQLSKGSAPFQDDDKKNLSKTISAFANNSGGILVWGVEARKNKNGEDVAQALHPIQGLKAAETAARSLVPQVTSGALGNIEYEAIEATTGSNTGFLVMHIPVAETEPIMATATGLNRYYTRNSESCIAMSHAQIGDMFARRIKPRLKTIWRIDKDHVQRLTIILGVLNTGRVLARYIGMRIESVSIEPPQAVMVATFNFNALTSEDDGSYLLSLDPSVYLHPASGRYYLRLLTGWPNPESLPTELNLRMEILCDGYREEVELRISKADLEDSLKKLPKSK